MNNLGRRVGILIIVVFAAVSLFVLLRPSRDSKAEERNSESADVEGDTDDPGSTTASARLQGRGRSVAPQPGVQGSPSSDPLEHAHAHPPEVTGLPSENLKRKHQSWGLPDTPLGRAMTEHLDSFEAAGPDAQRKFDQTLAKLRANPEASAKMAFQAYEKTAKDDIASRTALTGLLTQLESHEAFQPLKKIALEPIPSEIPRAGEAPELAAEGVIRISAVRGLGELAGRGNTDALQALADAVRSGDPTIRRYAAQMYVEAEGDSREARRAMAELLPENERAVVEARPMSPGDQPQPDPVLSKPLKEQPERAKTARAWQE